MKRYSCPHAPPGMVNTFLPYPSFEESARVLDWRRLGKQRVEAQQILRVLEDLEVVAQALRLRYEGGSVSQYIRNVVSRYRALPCLLVQKTNGTLYWQPRIIQFEGRPIKLGWVNHAATRMWFGHLGSLRLYLHAMITEWVRRGFKNTMSLPALSNNITHPPWLGLPDFHLSHQGNLIRKDPTHYSPLFPHVSASNTYVWPV